MGRATSGLATATISLCWCWLLIFIPAAAADDSISVTQSCYDETHQQIVVNFSNDNRHADDWIGLFAANQVRFNPNNLAPLPRYWLWTCGNQGCSDARAGGKVRFTAAGNGIDAHWEDPLTAQTKSSAVQGWPLPPGHYQAVLTGGSHPFAARAVSQIFLVLPPGQRCGPPNSQQDQQQQVDMQPRPMPQQPSGQQQQQQAVATTIHPNSRQMASVIANAVEDIKAIIDADRDMGAKFLRLAFHDCVGICDGCVDFKNPDNAGLGLPIHLLTPVVTKYEPAGLTRTDIWSMSAVVASDVLQFPDTDKTPLAFPIQWIGRQTCQQLYNDDCGVSYEGTPAACALARGPHRELCHADAGTDDIMEFFDREYGFDGRQVAAIMGAHTLGKMRRETLGFHAPQGWDLTNDRLDNGYYLELTGNVDDPFGTLPDWKQIEVDNTDLEDIPNRLQWSAKIGNHELTMLNSDIALVRHINNGEVTCNFKPRAENHNNNNCPYARQTIEHMIEYAWDRDLFLEDYRDVLYLMVENGYKRSGVCPPGEVCVLIDDEKNKRS